jgi:hypothetical protein
VTYLCAGASLLIAVLAVWPGQQAPSQASGASSSGPAGLHRSSLNASQRKACAIFALVLFLVAGVVGVFGSSSKGAAKDPATTAGPSASGDSPTISSESIESTPTQDASTAGSPTESPSSTIATPDTDVIDWSGRVRLSTDLDLDATPVQPAGNDDICLEGNTKATFKVRTATSTNGSSLWNDKDNPSKSQCDEKVRTDQDAPGGSWVKWATGDAMCIITNGGHDVFLRVTAVADNGITFYVARWL